jgi:1-acyl-sn-glycerol-3-phosphate acyltransferase
MSADDPHASPVEPGELGAFDRAYAQRHWSWIARWFGRYFRAQLHGLERFPERPFLSVGNHHGAVMMPEAALLLSGYHAAGRSPPLLSLAHDLMFSVPPRAFARALGRLGAIRSGRTQALEALRQGYALHVFPGGEIDGYKPFWRRNQIDFAGRTGYVRLALRAGVPIVPVVSIGAHEVLFVWWDGRSLARRLGLDRRLRLEILPILSCIPWLLWIGVPPPFLPLPAQVTIQVLEPLPLDEYDASAADDPAIVARIDAEVRARMQAALDELARGRLPILGRPRAALARAAAT